MRVVALGILASILGICIGCSTVQTVQTVEKFTVEECIRACSPLVPYGFRPAWSKETGVCACLVPPPSSKTRKYRIHLQE